MKEVVTDNLHLVPVVVDNDQSVVIDNVLVRFLVFPASASDRAILVMYRSSPNIITITLELRPMQWARSQYP